MERGIYGIEERRLTHTAVAAEKGNLTGNEFFYLFDARALDDRNLINRIADRLIDSLYFAVESPQFGGAVVTTIEVALVEYDDGGDVVGFCCDKKTVDEARGCTRKPESCDET